MLASIASFLRVSPWHNRQKGFRLFYDWRTRSDSIFALATSIDAKRGSPLGIIRVSGSISGDTLHKLTGKRPARHDEANHKDHAIPTIQPRYATLSKLFDPNTNDLIDVGLVLWFPKPNSYTGEDLFEFHVHGSNAVIKRIISTLGTFENMRPAEPGEFTRRAVENGKLDLIQAESLSYLISSQTDRQRELALKGLSGSTRAKYENWVERLMKVLAHLEASIDFGEDELIGELKVIRECTEELKKLSKEVSSFLVVAGRCMDLVDLGARVAILGRPNAGKSTFMNILCRQEKSIVSNVSGTTRDLIEYSFDLSGHKVTLCDTAGIRNLSLTPDNEATRDHEEIEQEGIKRAIEAACNADIIIYMLDADSIRNSSSHVIFKELFEVLNPIMVHEKPKSLHLVINKIDLIANAVEDIETDVITTTLESMFREKTDVCLTMISCKAQLNLEKIIKNVTLSLDKLQSNGEGCDGDAVHYVNERHLSLLQSATRHIDDAKCLNINRIDEMAQHVRESVDYLSRIAGEVTNEQIIDIIFRDFCIGK